MLNVGSGAGSYEPTDRLLLAVEPSALVPETCGSHPFPEKRRDMSCAFDHALGVVSHPVRAG